MRAFFFVLQNKPDFGTEENSNLMVDTVTGKKWLLSPEKISSHTKNAVFSPIFRLYPVFNTYIRLFKDN
jgi:hypothetical protein